MADLFLIPYVRSIWRMLGCRLGADGRMVIFGAGLHTRWLLSVTADLAPPPIACIVDDGPGVSSLGGIDVCTPSEVDIASIDLVLVSSDRWEDELATRVRALWGDRVEVVRLYEGLPCGPYDKTDDHAETLRRLRNLSPTRPAAALQVVIVSDEPRSREAKIGYGLRESGWRPVLLHRREPTFDPSPFFESIRRFGHEWEALRLACGYSPVAYHVMVNSDYRLASLLVRHRPGVVVIDSYDLIAGMYTDEFLAWHRDFAHEIARERYCLEHADGICTRSREPDVLEETGDHALAPRVFLADGCWNRPVVAEPSRARGLHVAYVGKLYVGAAGGEHFASCGCNLPLARVLTSCGLHLHAYPSPAQWDEHNGRALIEYCRLERADPRFHLHEPVPPDQLTAELARYDLAMSVYPERVVPTGTPLGFRPDKLRLCTTNKFFDYMDAGLPILHNAEPDSHLASIVNRHGIGIDAGAWPIEEWVRRLRDIDLTSLRRRVVEARADYDIRRRIGSLTEFYERLRDARPRKDTENDGCEEPTHADGGTERRPAFV